MTETFTRTSEYIFYNTSLERYVKGALDLDLVSIDTDITFTEDAVLEEKTEDDYTVYKDITSNEIYQQFLKDFPRMSIYVNMEMVTSVKELFEYMSQHDTYQHNILVILLMCTQTFLAYPCEILRDSIDEVYSDDIYGVSEISHDDTSFNHTRRMLCYIDNDYVMVSKNIRTFCSRDVFHTLDYFNINIVVNIATRRINLSIVRLG